MRRLFDFIYPDYKNHRGGMGAIITTYSSFFEDFKFIASFRPFKSNIYKSLFFLKMIFVMIRTLALDKEIEIVHIHGSHKGSFYRKLFVFWIAKKIFNKKIIYHSHSSTYHIFYKNSNKFTKKLIQYLIISVDLFAYLSPWWGSFYESIAKAKSKQRCTAFRSGRRLFLQPSTL